MAEAAAAHQFHLVAHGMRVHHLEVERAAAAAPSPEQERRLCRRHRHLSVLQHNVVLDELNPIRVLGLRASLEEAAFLQVKPHPKAKPGTKPRAAKSVTTEEFKFLLHDIIWATKKAWPADIPFEKAIFMYDNPTFHRLSEVQKQWLLQKTPLVSAHQLKNPPCYSGDFMQCIEHVHAIICRRWWVERLGRDGEGTWEIWEAELQAIFNDTISAEGVSNNVLKLCQLLAHVSEKGTGDYAPSNLT